jgi:hypothetical protein
LDAEAFRTEIYPVLLRDCGFNRGCHGDPGRIFHVLGPGRSRIDPALHPDDPATPLELQISYDRARAMVHMTETLESSPLLVKPLALDAGGVGHKGVDAYGNNIYATRDAPNYRVLEQWALSLAQQPGASLPQAGGSAP